MVNSERSAPISYTIKLLPTCVPTIIAQNITKSKLIDPNYQLSTYTNT